MSRYFSYVYLYPLLRSNQESINLLYREYKKKYNNEKKENSLQNLNIYKHFANFINIKSNILIKNNNDFNQKEAYDNFCLVCNYFL